jgi:hypothetical protein
VGGLRGKRVQPETGQAYAVRKRTARDADARASCAPGNRVREAGESGRRASARVSAVFMRDATVAMRSLADMYASIHPMVIIFYYMFFDLVRINKQDMKINISSNASICKYSNMRFE